VEKRKCVEPSQCGREMPTTVERVLNEDRRSCIPELVCPHNEDEVNVDYGNICQYTVEIVEVFKGGYQVCMALCCYYTYIIGKFGLLLDFYQ